MTTFILKALRQAKAKEYSIVLTGDFNGAMNPAIDRANSNQCTYPETSLLKAIAGENYMIDL